MPYWVIYIYIFFHSGANYWSITRCQIFILGAREQGRQGYRFYEGYINVIIVNILCFWNRGLYNRSITSDIVRFCFHKHFFPELPFNSCVFMCKCVYAIVLKTLFWVAAKKERSLSPELLLYRSASPTLLTAQCQSLFSCMNVVYNAMGWVLLSLFYWCCF